MRVVIFSGTTEGRALSEETVRLGLETVVCVATEYGRTLQEEHPGAKTLTGRLDAPAMEKVLEGAALCVDATHPYAREASRNIVAAAKKTSVPYKRLVRPKSLLPDKCQMVESATEAARVLEKTTGNILLTTGVKELGAFSRLNPNRLFPRVLPSRESIRLCEENGIPQSHIIAMQGPFSRGLNRALMEQFAIRWLVTKDGGAAGGFPEKIEAAGDLQVPVLVIRRPEETGDTWDEIIKKCKELMACR